MSEPRNDEHPAPASEGESTSEVTRPSSADVQGPAERTSSGPPGPRTSGTKAVSRPADPPRSSRPDADTTLAGNPTGSLSDAVVAALANVTAGDEANVSSVPPSMNSEAPPPRRAANGAEAMVALGETAGPPAGAMEARGISIGYFGRTDVGLVREHNEDNFLVADLSSERRGCDDEEIVRAELGNRGLVLAVCDGMGGAAAGEVASQMAVDTIYDVLRQSSPPRDRDQFARRLVRAVEEAGARIFAAAKMDRSRRGMGTTATVAGLVDSTLFVGQVGDSRAYVLRGDQFALITKDQSLVNQLIEAGQLTEEEAEAFEHSNIILQALGTTEEVAVDLTFLELRRGDRLLMCSDGLSGLVHGDVMREVLKQPDLREAAAQLIQMANAGGGHDNITVIVGEFDGDSLRDATPDARVAYQQYPLPPPDPSEIENFPPGSSYMKPPGTKPGADVKYDAASGGATSSGIFWAGLLLLVIVILVAAAVLLLDDGASTANGDAQLTVSPESGQPSGLDESDLGVIVVEADPEPADLFINGQAYTTVTDGTARIQLPAGAYHLQLRDDEAEVAERMVTLQAGTTARVELRAPPMQSLDEMPPRLGHHHRRDPRRDEARGDRSSAARDPSTASPIEAGGAARAAAGVPGASGLRDGTRPEAAGSAGAASPSAGSAGGASREERSTGPGASAAAGSQSEVSPAGGAGGAAAGAGRLGSPASGEPRQNAADVERGASRPSPTPIGSGTSGISRLIYPIDAPLDPSFEPEVSLETLAERANRSRTGIR